MPADASGRELTDLALRVLRAVAENEGEATAHDLADAIGEDAAAIEEELSGLVRSGHLAGSPRAQGDANYGLLPAGRVALRLN